jgi:archaellum component FlaC
MDLQVAVWNILLTTFIGLIGWNMREKSEELSRLQILLNKTREEIARDNVTQNEIDKIVDHIDARFDKLNDKIDAFIRESRSVLK